MVIPTGEMKGPAGERSEIPTEPISCGEILVPTAMCIVIRELLIYPCAGGTLEPCKFFERIWLRLRLDGHKAFTSTRSFIRRLASPSTASQFSRLLVRLMRGPIPLSRATAIAILKFAERLVQRR
jgi:hypothetical protein